METFDVRQYVPGLPDRITREYLSQLSAEQQAALLRTFDQGVSTMREEQIRAEFAITQREAEVKRLEKEAQDEFGVSTPEELSALLELQTADVVAQWGEVAKLMDGAAA